MGIVFVPAHIFTTDTAKVVSGACSVSGEKTLVSVEFLVKLPLTKNVKTENKPSTK